MRDKILALRKRGLSIRQIEKVTHIHRGTISYILDPSMKDRKSKTRLKRHHKMKEQAISYKGGKCINCGFSTIKSALEFHHLDPTIKEIGIAKAFARNYSFEQLKIELDKCILVCANCHRGIHSGEIKITG